MLYMPRTLRRSWVSRIAASTFERSAAVRPLSVAREIAPSIRLIDSYPKMAGGSGAPNRREYAVRNAWPEAGYALRSSIGEATSTRASTLRGIPPRGSA